jgi:hypothetical protein
LRKNGPFQQITFDRGLYHKTFTAVFNSEVTDSVKHSLSFAGKAGAYPSEAPDCSRPYPQVLMYSGRDYCVNRSSLLRHGINLGREKFL